LGSEGNKIKDKAKNTPMKKNQTRTKNLKGNRRPKGKKNQKGGTGGKAQIRLETPLRKKREKNHRTMVATPP